MSPTDENGVPSVAGANAMFAAMDEARANREWREAQSSGPPRLCCGEFETGSGQHGDECDDDDDAPEERGAPVDDVAAVAALAGIDPPTEKPFARLAYADDKAPLPTWQSAAPDINEGVAVARRCSTETLLAVLAKRGGIPLLDIVRLLALRAADASMPAPEASKLCSAGQAICDVAKALSVAPIERTPEVVLRHMLAAYEKAALEAAIPYFQSENGSETERRALDRYEALDVSVGQLRDGLASLLAGRTTITIENSPVLGADYEARLAGARPLDAPPEGT